MPDFDIMHVYFDVCALARFTTPGEESCWVEFNPGEETDDDVLGRSFNRTMIFEPARAAMGARCSCTTIDR